MLRKQQLGGPGAKERKILRKSQTKKLRKLQWETNKENDMKGNKIKDQDPSKFKQLIINVCDPPKSCRGSNVLDTEVQGLLKKVAICELGFL